MVGSTKISSSLTKTSCDNPTITTILHNSDNDSVLFV